MTPMTPMIPTTPISRIFLLTLLVLVMALTQVKTARADEPDKRTLTLAATGRIETIPDKVEISTGVRSEAKTAREALDRNSEAMVKMVAGLKSAGIEPKDIQTTNFSVQPVYDRSKDNRDPFIVGYRVVNAVQISLRDTKRLGDILDKIVTLGANQIGSIRFGVSEPEAAKDAARKQAMEAAIANAKLYAEAANVELGPVLTISEEQSVYQPRALQAAARMESAKAVPIEAGSASVEIRIRVTWELIGS